MQWHVGQAHLTGVVDKSDGCDTIRIVSLAIHPASVCLLKKKFVRRERGRNLVGGLDGDYNVNNSSESPRGHASGIRCSKRSGV
jgi:hypothetical protein